MIINYLEIKKRIEEVREHLNLTIEKFAPIAGYTSESAGTTYGNIIYRKDRKVPLQMILTIAINQKEITQNDIDLNWLLLGVGQMFVQETDIDEDVKILREETQNLKKNFVVLEGLIGELQKENAEIKKQMVDSRVGE